MKTKIKPTIVEDDDCFLWEIFFVDDAIISTMKNELQIFQRLCVKLIELINPLGGGQYIQSNFRMCHCWLVMSLA
jgi:hypothetical protein